METFFSASLQGILLGGVYALVALGVLVVYKSCKIFNMAHGEMMVLAAYVAWWLSVSRNLPVAAAIVLAILASALTGWVINRVVIKPVIGKPMLVTFLLTLGMLDTWKIIIGLLAGYVAPRYFGQIGKSEAKVAKAQLDSLEKALDQYRLDTGRYPSTEIGLTALVTKPSSETKWSGPYLKKAVPLDRDVGLTQQRHQYGVGLGLERKLGAAPEDAARTRVDEHVVKPVFGRIPAVHAHGPTS